MQTAPQPSNERAEDSVPSERVDLSEAGSRFGLKQKGFIILISLYFPHVSVFVLDSAASASGPQPAQKPTENYSQNSLR